MKIQLITICPLILQNYIHFIKNILFSLQISFSCITLPLKKKRITLLKSPHVNKKAKDQFEIQYYKTVFILKSSLNFNFIKYIFLNKPKSLNLIIKK